MFAERCYLYDSAEAAAVQPRTFIGAPNSASASAFPAGEDAERRDGEVRLQAHDGGAWPQGARGECAAGGGGGLRLRLDLRPLSSLAGGAGPFAFRLERAG